MQRWLLIQLAKLTTKNFSSSDYSETVCSWVCKQQQFWKQQCYQSQKITHRKLLDKGLPGWQTLERWWEAKTSGPFDTQWQKLISWICLSSSDIENNQRWWHTPPHCLCVHLVLPCHRPVVEWLPQKPFFSGFCKLEVGDCSGLSLVQLVCTRGAHESAFRLEGWQG